MALFVSAFLGAYVSGVNPASSPVLTALGCLPPAARPTLTCLLSVQIPFRGNSALTLGSSPFAVRRHVNC